jgi:PleD family two-component response regulator
MQHSYLREVQVLIVDDQRFSRVLLRRILGVLGCRRVTEAKSVDLAWNSILLSPPDLLIVDWEMEESDGLELVRRVRHDESTPDRFMPIIMLTAHSELPRIVVARDAGINEFIIKPLSPAILFKRLDAVIEHPRQFIRIKSYFGPDRRRKKSSYSGAERRRQAQDAAQETPNPQTGNSA